MDLEPKRRRSRELPPNLSDLMNTLIQRAASFIKLFDISQPRMTEIIGEFEKIVADVRQMQQSTDRTRTTGAVIVRIIGAVFTGGLSLAAAGAAAGGVVAVAYANVSKIMAENGSAEKVEELGKEFMRIVEPMKENLEEIKTTCEKLEEKSAEAQAEKTLTDTEELDKLLRRVSELHRQSEAALKVVTAGFHTIRGLLVLIVAVFRLTATPEEDAKLRASITQSADQIQKVTEQFGQMKQSLTVFTQ